MAGGRWQVDKYASCRWRLDTVPVRKTTKRVCIVCVHTRLIFAKPVNACLPNLPLATCTCNLQAPY